MASATRSGSKHITPPAWRCAALVAVTLAAASVFNVGSAFAGHVSCGDVITVDTKLDSDLVDCPSDALIIRADGVTLDLAGHTIYGDGAEFEPELFVQDRGIVVAASGVTIQNGAVYGFPTGIVAGRSQDAPNVVRGIAVGCDPIQCPPSQEAVGIHVTGRDSNLLIDGSTIINSTMGVRMAGSTNRVENSRFFGNGTAMYVTGAANVIRDNLIEDSSRFGVLLIDDAQVNLVERNSIRGGETGIWLTREASGSTVRHNNVRHTETGIRSDDETEDGLISGNQVANASRIGIDVAFTLNDRVVGNTVRRSARGIVGTRATGAEIAGNRVLRSATHGIVLAEPFAPVSTRTRLSGNVVRRSGGDGILINPFVMGTVLEHNTTSQNGDDGIDVDSAQTTITRNRADHNRDLGIEAVDGVTDGGGNRARRNGNPLQCTGVVCR